MSETLLDIIDETKGPHYQDPSLCILVGHSFGGLLLEHALTQTLINVLEREASEQEDCKTVKFSPPVDLITFINEAAPAIEAKRPSSICPYITFIFGGIIASIHCLFR
jgi:hypothetical protein